MTGRQARNHGGGALSPTGGTPNSERFAVWLAVGLLVAVFLFGGSSRADAFSQFFARVSAVLFGAVALVTVTSVDLRKINVPFGLCVAWTLLIMIQLIPLPPSIWTELPGRERFIELAALAGIDQPWRPLSLVPEATANSALAMLIPLAVLLTTCQVPARRLPVLLMTLVGFALVSGMIGVAQVAAGGSSIYDGNNHGVGVGLFANRNHQAAMLAATVPLLAGLASLTQRDPSDNRFSIAATIVFALIFPLVFVTGSRSGVLLLVVGIASAALVLFKIKPGVFAVRRLRTRPLLVTGALGIIAAGAALALFQVGAADRLLTQSVEEDLRVSLFVSVAEMTRLYFPVGGGFGTFPTLFKIDEPFWWLNYLYFNHAHNDLIEIVAEGGLPAVLLLLAFLGWLMAAAWRLWRAPFARSTDHLLGLIATAALVILLLASLVDYPLRTPGLAAVTAVLLVFIARADKSLSSGPPMVGRRRDDN